MVTWIWDALTLFSKAYKSPWQPEGWGGALNVPPMEMASEYHRLMKIGTQGMPRLFSKLFLQEKNLLKKSEAEESCSSLRKKMILYKN